MIFHDFEKWYGVWDDPGIAQKKIRIPSERPSKIIRINVENDSFDQLYHLIIWVKGGHILQT